MFAARLENMAGHANPTRLFQTTPRANKVSLTDLRGNPCQSDTSLAVPKASQLVPNVSLTVPKVPLTIPKASQSIPGAPLPGQVAPQDIPRDSRAIRKAWLSARLNSPTGHPYAAAFQWDPLAAHEAQALLPASSAVSRGNSCRHDTGGSCWSLQTEIVRQTLDVDLHLMHFRSRIEVEPHAIVFRSHEGLLL